MMKVFMKSFLSVTAVITVVTAEGADKIRLIAHRGGAMEAEENTLAAFTDAYEHGLRAFETDVRMTRDGELVLMDGDSASRTTNGYGPVELMTGNQVKALHTKCSGKPVPFLSDLLSAFKGKTDVFLQLEIKPGNGPINDARLERFAEKLAELATGALPSNAFCCASFDKRSLAAVKRVTPGVPTMLLYSREPDATLIEDLKTLGCCGVSVIPELTKSTFVEAAEQAGFKVTGWSVRTDESLELAQSLGFESVITDCPRRMLKDGFGCP